MEEKTHTELSINTFDGPYGRLNSLLIDLRNIPHRTIRIFQNLGSENNLRTDDYLVSLDRAIIILACNIIIVIGSFTKRLTKLHSKI